MFNKTVIMPTSHSTRVVDRHVTINNAPTDESVKMLRELEKAALEKVEKSFRLPSNLFECLVHVHHEHFSDSITLIAHFKLNAQQHKVEINRFLYKLESNEQKADFVLDFINEIARVIAENILRQSVPELVAKLFK